MAQHQPTIITLDAPGAGTTTGYGTQAAAVGPAGLVAGYYVGLDNVVHAYVWVPEGRFTPYDAPGAARAITPAWHSRHDGKFFPFDGPNMPSYVATDPYSPPTTWLNTSSPGTYALAFDAMGDVMGYYVDANIVAHGFLRTPWGKFTSFDVPNAGTGAYQGTFASTMNLEGTIAGSYTDANWGSHSFVRYRDGHTIEFDPPDGIGSSWVNFSQCISTTGIVVGNYADNNGVTHGFVRDPKGDITEFAVAATGLTAGQGTSPNAINSAGTVVGTFVDASNVNHSLIRTAAGKITVFDPPGAAGNNVAEAIDEAGNATGFYNDANWVHHGYVRSPERKYTFFDVQPEVSGFKQGTLPIFNTVSTVVGFYVDANYVWHGFVRK